MTDTVTLTGVVATKPENVRTNKGLTVANFRLASSQRRLDRVTGLWVDGDTNWYTINAYRWLANNVANSLDVGQHVVVTGRLRVRNWTSGDKKGTAIEVDVDAIGHDLAFGVSQFQRLKAAVPIDQAGAQTAGQGFDPGSSDDPGAPDDSAQHGGGERWSTPMTEGEAAIDVPDDAASLEAEPTRSDADKVPF